MKSKKILLPVLLCTFGISCAFSQVNFSGNPVSIGRNADALLSINAISSYNKPMAGEIIVTVKEDNADIPILTVIFSNIIVSPGINGLSKFRSQVNRTFYDNAQSALVKSNGSFPPGTYSICCIFNPSDKDLTIIDKERCFFNTIMPRSPLSLIEPIDSICNYRPPFIWLGRKTAGQGVAFRIVCAEIKDKQSPEEALQSNPPLFNILQYSQVNQMAYPAGTAALKEGKKYAWQVIEVAGNSVLNNSEVNMFNVGCKETTETTVESFADVKSYYTGKKYYFTSSVNFSFENRYAIKNLSYSITSLSTQKKLSNLPPVKMTTGLNKVSLNVEDIKGLNKNEQYKMEIYNLGSAVYYLNFIIKED